MTQIFPFQVTFKKNISKFNFSNEEKLIKYIIQQLEKRNAKISENKDSLIQFKNVLFSGKFRNLDWIDKGEIRIIKSSNELIIQYRFSLIQFISISLMIAFIFFLISGQIRIGTLAFLWLGGIGYILNLLRQYIFLSDLIYEFNGSLRT